MKDIITINGITCMTQEEKAREYAKKWKDGPNGYRVSDINIDGFIAGAKWQEREDRDNVIRALDYLFELMHGTIVGSTDAHVKWLKDNFIRKYEE